VNFLFFILYQSTALSRSTVDSHQMYFGGSVVRKASTIGIDISPTSPLIFTGVRQCQNLASFSTFSRPRLNMQQYIRTLN